MCLLIFSTLDLGLPLTNLITVQADRIKDVFVLTPSLTRSQSPKWRRCQTKKPVFRTITERHFNLHNLVFFMLKPALYHEIQIFSNLFQIDSAIKVRIDLFLNFRWLWQDTASGWAFAGFHKTTDWCGARLSITVELSRTVGGFAFGICQPPASQDVDPGGNYITVSLWWNFWQILAGF